MNRDICIEVLQKELIPALGCTEPIAVAYAAAKARQVLGRFPEKIALRCSGNIIKNVKGVTVPCSKGMKGLDAAAILGTVGGDPSRELEVLSTVTDKHIDITKELMKKKEFFSCSLVQGVPNLYISVGMWAGDDSSEVEIVDYHTNIQQIKKNGEIIFSGKTSRSAEESSPLSALKLEDIFRFGEEVDIDLIKSVLSRQVEFNSRISDYGLRENCGANIGSTLLAGFPDDVALRARARAAAASDARMSGCSLPVVINSGSGNQGITVSLPVVEYWKHLELEEDRLYRALAISNLSALYVKRYIGSLSAFCGAVVAASGASAAIVYLHGGSHEQMGKAIVNTLANVGGIVCDGAKASCAAKISSAVDAAVLAFKMSMNGISFPAGEGIVQSDPEKTIQAVGYVGRVGMAQTDTEILNLMIDKVQL